MYNYAQIKSRIFTEDGQVLFLKVRDFVQVALKRSGSVRMQEVLGVGGDTWVIMACVDRLVELGEIREIDQGNVPGQHRVFLNN